MKNIGLKKILTIVGCLLLILIFGVTGLYFYLPRYVETTLLPEINKGIKIGRIKCNVRNIGLFQTDLTEVKLGNELNSTLSIDSIRINYSPFSLLNKHIDKVILSGIKLQMEYNNNNLSFPGLDLKSLLSSNSTDDSSKMNFTPPVSIGCIEIRNSTILIERDGKTYRFQITLRVNPLKQDYSTLGALFEISHQDYKVKLEANISSKKLKDDELNVSSELRFNFIHDPSNLNLSAPFRLTAEIVDTDNWTFNLNNKNKIEKIDFEYKLFNISGTLPEINISSSGGQVNGDNSIDASLNINLNNTTIHSEYGEVSIPNYSLQGSATYRNKKIEAAGVVGLKNLTCNSNKFESKINGVSFTFPFVWPINNNQISGNIHIKNILYKDIDIGSVVGTLLQDNIGVEVQGQMNSDTFPALNVKLDGNSVLSFQGGLNTETKFNVNCLAEESISLEKLFPILGKTAVCGKLAINGNLNINSGILKSSLNVNAENAGIKSEEKGISVEGINLNLSFPDLMKLRSAPNQQFSFRNITFQNFNFSDGEVVFQIESPQSIFIERGFLVWCKGYNYLQGMRISPGKDNYKIRLFCDRLNLADILDQFGTAKAEGKGTVSGIITIDTKDKKIVFEDSVLYSSPGNGGVIKLTGTEMLTAGIPKNSIQYNQLEFARQSLNDFQYDWVRLNLVNQGDDCIIKLSLLGKPANPLSFKFNKKIGGYVKADVKEMQASIQPMRLDINFRIPLNEILNYQTGITELLDKLSH